MIAQDKFGNPIYPRVFRALEQHGYNLKMLGYTESLRKPNLFYRKNEELGVVFFADMRGTEEVPIWSDVRPLLYWHFMREYPNWLKRRLVKSELVAIDGRLSFYEVWEPEGLMSNDSEDGYCKFCGKDFSDKGLYCSKECEDADSETYQTHCAVCGKVITYETKITHHVSYEPEKTIDICRSCHSKIHRTNKYQKLKPKQKRIGRCQK